MSNFEENVVFALLGAFISAIFSPAMEAIFLGVNNKDRERAFTISNGLLLLCAANAFWVVPEAFELYVDIYGEKYDIENMRSSTIMVFYTIATAFFIVSIIQFKNITSNAVSRKAIAIICSLAIANLIWVFYDMYHVLTSNRENGVYLFEAGRHFSTWLSSNEKYPLVLLWASVAFFFLPVAILLLYWAALALRYVFQGIKKFLLE